MPFIRCFYSFNTSQQFLEPFITGALSPPILTQWLSRGQSRQYSTHIFKRCFISGVKNISRARASFSPLDRCLSRLPHYGQYRLSCAARRKLALSLLCRFTGSRISSRLLADIMPSILGNAHDKGWPRTSAASPAWSRNTTMHFMDVNANTMLQKD